MPFSTSVLLASPLQSYTSQSRKLLARRGSVTTHFTSPASHSYSTTLPSADDDSIISLQKSSSLQESEVLSLDPVERVIGLEKRRLSQQLPALPQTTTSSTLPRASTEPLTTPPTSKSRQQYTPIAASDLLTLAPALLLAAGRSPEPGPLPGAVPSTTQSKPIPSLLYHNLSASTLPSIVPAADRKQSPSQGAGPVDSQRRKKHSRPQNRSETRSVSSTSTLAEKDKKMHQTSSRLLRMTDDERPYTKDFKDLFSTLMVSLPLSAHRVRFQKVDHTFTSEEAITNLGSLKFSQSNRMPDPKDPSRIVTTTTTTTFSMAKEMARSVCQKFLDARFIEAADTKNDFAIKTSVWQLTPKGMHILHRFCMRNGIQQDHVRSVLDSPRNSMKLVILERDVENDRLSHDQATIEVIFRRFVGATPNAKADAATADSDSIHEYSTGLVGVKMLNERKVGDKVYKKSFTGKAATDWLMDCCTMVDRRETFEVANLFVEYGLIAPVEGFSSSGRFQASKGAIYYVTDRGQNIAGWLTLTQGSLNGDPKVGPTGVPHNSNTNRMTAIVKDPALRLLFREYLRHTHCEENLSFYIDVSEFLSNYRNTKKSNSTPKLEFIRETLAAAYSLYNAFLAPGSPCELNIDHSLRIALASRMTRAVGDDDAMIRSLDEVASLFEQAQNTVFKLMATDSVPKFSRDPKYAAHLKERNLDAQLAS